MSFNKHGLLSPAVNQQQAPPTDEGENKLFEDQFSQMAYQAFSSKFPDQTTAIVTFKILDSDIDQGTAVGAFILEAEGEFIYVPTILSDNQLKPFDLMYVKSKDIFLPLDPKWIEEIKKGALLSMGEGAELPDTVATDVDIRNLMVPPTTGRYSYASYDVSPKNKLEAKATEPLGRKITKIANEMAMPMEGPGGVPGQGGVPPTVGVLEQGQQGQGQGQAPKGGSGEATQDDFNPEIWETFVEQFQRINGTTPGKALDEGMMDVETLSKMYKSHQKTWDMAAEANQAMMGQQMDPAAQQGQPMAAAPVGAGGQQVDMSAAPGPAGPGTVAPKMASARSEIAEQGAETMGEMFDRYMGHIGRGSAVGAGVGGVQAGMDGRLGDVPGDVLAGAVGGGVGALPGRMVGKALARRYPGHLSAAPAAVGGTIGGGAAGGYLMSRSDPRTMSQWTAPSQAALQEYAQERRASADDSDHVEAFAAMIKHAQRGTEHRLNLPDFLSKAPNQVKTAFAKVLSENPKLLKAAGDIYGESTLVEALQHKEATAKEQTGGALYVYDEDTDPDTLEESFGSAAPEAFNGILMRGYYFKDSRPSLNLAVQTQHYHDFHDPMEAGVYRIHSAKGTPKPALVTVEPIDLISEDRYYYPKDSAQVKPAIVDVNNDSGNREPHSLDRDSLENPEPEMDRLRRYIRLAVFGNGDYFVTEKLMGEQVTELALKDSKLYGRVMSEGKSKPAKGTGMWVTKDGSNYKSTLPVEVDKIRTDSSGVVRGQISSPGGTHSKTFVMDPRSPVGKIKRLRDQDIVIIPASWKWMPLKKELNPADYLRTPQAISDIVQDSLQSMGVHEAVARSAGQDMYAVNGSKTMSKKEALYKLASDNYIHAADAESMLKIADIEGSCRAWIASPRHVQKVGDRIKIAQGQMAPATQMGGPPAMQQPQVDPAQIQTQAIEAAFSQSMDQLQDQINALNAQLQVLMSVQQRAQQLMAQATGAPPPAPMQGAAPQQAGMQGQQPGMQGQQAAPAQAGMQGAPQQGMQQQQQPPQAGGMPIMRTEEPSSMEIAEQVNPAFLEQASELQETGAFDAGAISSLSKDPSVKALGSQYAASLENSVDDLGRTLLTLYMQESKLKEQLGDETFVDLESQLRDTFKGLGSLVLSITHNTAMLEDDAVN